MFAQVAPLLAAGGGTGEGNPLLRFEPGLAIWTVVVFLLLLIVLWRFGWGTLIGKLDERDQSIRGAIDDASSQREEAAKLLEEQKALLAKSRRETSDLLAEAQSDAKAERQRILDEARAEYEKILARGRDQIEQETRAALSEIRRTVADLSIDVASEVLRRSVADKDHRDFAERFVAELEKKRGA